MSTVMIIAIHLPDENQAFNSKRTLQKSVGSTK